MLRGVSQLVRRPETNALASTPGRQHRLREKRQNIRTRSNAPAKLYPQQKSTSLLGLVPAVVSSYKRVEERAVIRTRYTVRIARQVY